MTTASRTEPILHMSRARQKRVASACTSVTMVVAVWAMFWPSPYGLVVGACFALPLVAIALDVWTGGAFNWRERRGGAPPLSLASMLVLPSLVLAMRAGQDFNFPHWRAMLVWSIIGGLSVLCGFVWLDAGLRTNKGQLVSIVLFSFLFCFGALAMGDVMLDTSPVQIFRTIVRAKEFHWHLRGPNTYNLKVDAWGPLQVQGRVTVPHNVFVRVSVGDPVCIHSQNGSLGFPWYVVQSCRRDISSHFNSALLTERE